MSSSKPDGTVTRQPIHIPCKKQSTQQKKKKVKIFKACILPVTLYAIIALKNSAKTNLLKIEQDTPNNILRIMVHSKHGNDTSSLDNIDLHMMPSKKTKYQRMQRLPNH